MNKLLIFSFLIFAGFSAQAEYQPFQFTCVYDATTDGMITAESRLVPDNDDWTFYLTSSNNNVRQELEALDVFVYDHEDKMEEETKAAVEGLEKKLNIDHEEWFTVSEVILLRGDYPFVFYKFNSKDGSLGIGTYTRYLGQMILGVCE